MSVKLAEYLYLIYLQKNEVDGGRRALEERLLQIKKLLIFVNRFIDLI